MSILKSLVPTQKFNGLLKLAVVVSMLGLSQTGVLADDKNDAYRTAITALIVAHNAAYPPSLLLGPTGTAAGAVTYGTNLALKYVPPYLEQPNDFGVDPNILINGDICGRQLNIKRSQADYGNFLGLFPSFPTDWGALGAPYVEHANTDATLRILNSGVLLGTGDQVFDIGTHSLIYEAETLISYPLDVVLPVVLMYMAPFKNQPEGRQLILTLLLEAGLITLDQFVVDSTPHEVFPIVNRQVQRIQVYDRYSPEITLSQNSVRVEALSPGGANGDVALDALQPTVSTFDRCDQPVSLFADVPSFLPLGAHTITWTALDAGPNPDSSRSDQRNETTITQTLIVEDTTPPLLIPPADIVVESTGATSIKLGQPLIFDVVDVDPTVTCEVDQSPVDCQAFFNAPVGLTEVTWIATDTSGQAAEAVQLVNVKMPGANNTPVAHDQVLLDPVKSFDSIDIELTAQDMDGDRLAFAVVDRPDNGFFVAPLYPYFIEDYRIEAAPGSLTVEQRCDDLLGGAHGGPNFELEYPVFSEWVSVTDEGRSYVYDRGHVDCQSYFLGENPSFDLRIAVFDEQGELINAQFSGSDNEANDVWVNPATGRVYMVYGEIDTANGIVQLSPDLDSEFYYNMDRADGPGFDPDFGERIRSIVIDANGLLYAANYFNVSVYKIEGVTPQSNGTTIHPEYLGSLPYPNQNLNFDYHSLAIGPDGKIFASDRTRSRIYRYAASKLDDDGVFTAGELEGWLGKCTSDSNPGLETHCDVANQRSVGFSCTDQTCGVDFSSGQLPGQFSSPKGIAIDPNGVLYVTDFQNDRVQRFTPEGYVAGVAQSNCSYNCFVLGDFGKPSDISVNSNHFFILDVQTQLLHVSEISPIKEIRDTSVVIEYSSNNNFVGTDTFTFEATDGLREDGVFVTSNLATVTIPVMRNDRPPIADAGITATTDEDVPVVITLDGNDPDFPLDVVEFQISTPPQFGTLSGQGVNRTYSPYANYSGKDEFSFVLFDGTNTSEPESVTVTMAAKNDPPEIDPDDMNLFGMGYIGTIMVPFTDPDNEDVHRVAINWGDGSAVEMEGQAQSDGSLSGPLLQEGIGDSGVVVAEHLFSEEGAYQVQVCITDRVEVGNNGVKTNTPESTQTCSIADINVEQRPLVLVDIEPSNCVVNPDDEVEVPVCSATDGDNINYTLRIKNIMPDTSGGLAASNLIVTALVDPTLTVTSVGDPVARSMQGYSSKTRFNNATKQGGEGLEVATLCDWQDQVVTCSVDSLPTGSEVVISLNTSTDGMAVMDRDVRLATELAMDEANLAMVSKNVKDVFVALNPNGDADGDGVVNMNDAFPTDPNEAVDTDGDGIGNVADIDDDADSMPDAWEVRYGLAPLVADGNIDSDSDGLTNAEEYAAGVNPMLADTDSDSFLDGADNCAARFNQNQFDSNFDGVGDVCDLRATARALTAFDGAGDTAGDYAILRGSPLGSQLWIGDASGLWRHRVQVLAPDLTAIDMTRLDDVDGAGTAAIAVLADDVFGSTRVSLVNPVDGELVSEIFFFDPGWKARAVTVVEGAGSGGESALAVLAKQDQGGLRVQLRSANDGALLESIDVLAQGWQPIDISVLEDGSLAVLAAADSGQTKVVRSNAEGTLSEIDFLSTNAMALATLPANGDVTARYAVLAAGELGGAVLEIRDAKSGALVIQNFIASKTPVDITTLGQGSTKFALLLADPATAELSVSLRDESGVEIQPGRVVLSNAYEPRAVVNGYGEHFGVLGSDDRGVLSLALQASTTADDQGLLVTDSGANYGVLEFFNEWIELATGDVQFCTGGCVGVDFAFNQNSSQINPVVVNKRASLEAVFLDNTPFDDVSHATASGLNFSTAQIDDPFDYNDTLVVRLDNGDLYKVGHAQCFLNDVSFHSACIQQQGAFEVGFDWVLLAPDFDQDGVSDESDNCLQVANPNQLDTDGDGYGNACDADVNNDCVVNFIDVSAMTAVFLCSDDSPDCQNADLDGSGSVNFLDYSMLTSAFLQVPGPSGREDLCSLDVVIDQPLTLNNTLSYDLDSATGGPSNLAKMDLTFTRSVVTSRLTPIKGASIAYMGQDKPGSDECLETSMTVETISFIDSDVTLDGWFCVRTNAGNMSRFQITAANTLPSASQLEVDLTTWACDECETAYDPMPLGGLVGWFDADHAGSLELNGSSVASWQDRSGTIELMSSLTDAQRPGYTPNGINGRGSVTFDGVDDRLFASSNTSLGGGYTIFIAARNDVRQDYNGLLSLRRATEGVPADFEVYWQAGTTDLASGNIVVAANRQTSAFAYRQSNNAGPMFGSSYTMAARVSADSSIQQIHIDGENQSLIPGGSTFPDMTPNFARRMCLGQGFGSNIGGTTLDGDIGEVLVFDRALTDAEFDFVSTYIENKWSQD